jgi:hypothetical protein
LDGLSTGLVFKKDEFGDVYGITYDTVGQDIVIHNLSDGEDQQAVMNAQTAEITDVKFIVRPINDPAGPAGGLEQPRVTILMSLTNAEAPVRYKKTLKLQTTISSKIYR